MLYTYHRTPEREPIAYCEECKKELFEGDTVYKVAFSDKFYCEECISREELESDEFC